MNENKAKRITPKEFFTSFSDENDNALVIMS